MLPGVITHNYDPDYGPFRNLCALPPSRAEALLDEIRDSGKRRIKANYLRRRVTVEAWLMRESRRKLGATHLERPLYFFLGDFANGLDRSRPCSIVVPMAAFSSSMLTFTYPDSMASLPLATKAEHRAERRPYHGHVFTLEELENVVAQYGMPARQRSVIDTTVRDRFIEVQVWDDRPLQTLWDRENTVMPLARTA